VTSFFSATAAAVVSVALVAMSMVVVEAAVAVSEEVVVVGVWGKEGGLMVAARWCSLHSLRRH
jgi:hypothetical protein